MTDFECVGFLQWALPRLHLRWQGFRKVRRQVCRRIGRRLRELELEDTRAYAAWLEKQPQEWLVLDSFCRISISRFYRDRGVFELLRRSILPDTANRALAANEREVRCWCAGCASGEEPYTLGIVWRMSVQPACPGLSLRIVATDQDETLLARARRGCYPAGSLKDLPAEWRAAAFVPAGDECQILPEYRTGIEFIQQDVRAKQPDGSYHLIFCRNLVFTYFDAGLQAELLAKITQHLLPGGCLVIGIHESLPATGHGLVEAFPGSGILRKPAIA